MPGYSSADLTASERLELPFSSLLSLLVLILFGGQ